MSDDISWLPTAWPLLWRRAFFVTLPISGPLWLILIVVGHFLVGIFILAFAFPVFIIFELKEKLWDAPSPQGSEEANG